jgi:uncharacterized repeat protein (TIGR01451 family)
MEGKRSWGRRIAKGGALLTLVAAGLVLGVAPGAAGFGAGFAGLVDAPFGSNDSVLIDAPPSADLSVSMSDSQDPVTLGTQFEYDVTIRNSGPDDAIGVFLRETLPAEIALDSVDGASCSQDGAYYCQVGDLRSGGSATVRFLVHGLKPGSFTTSSAVWSQTADPNAGNDSADETTGIVLPPARGHLTVIAHVLNDNGGSAVAGDFTLVLDGVNANPSSFAGNEQGTGVDLDAGDYKVAVADGPSGYDASFSADCAGTIGRDEQKRCLVTFDDRPAHLTVVTTVMNDNSGTAQPSDFALAVKAGSPDPAQFSGNAEGTPVTLDAGGYAVSEETAYGYTTTLSADCQGKIGPGETRTCTVSNDDVAPVTLTLTADAATVSAGSATGYTATLRNPNSVPVNVSYLSVWLPNGFSYRQGSTSGAITSDPTIDNYEGLSLSWQGPGDVPAHETKRMHFGVTTPTTLGSYSASGSGNVDAPFSIDSSGASPQIVVVATAPPSNNPPPQSPSSGGGGSDPNQGQTTTTTQGPAPAGPPVFQSKADVQPVSGDVLVRLPGSADFVPLTADMQLDFGTEIDATNGRVTIVTVDSNGTTYRADFYGGRFVLKKQLANGITVLWLSGSDFKAACKTAKRTLSMVDKQKPSKKKTKKTKRSKKVVRHLWGSGKGKFRTKGRYIAATVHGTTWLTEDRCDGSRAYVQEGVVDARDLVKHKTIRLGAGQSYVARPH